MILGWTNLSMWEMRFISAPCLEKIYSRAGPEFSEKSDCIVTLNKALYGLRSSSRAFRAAFADFLRSMGFVATRCDRDVWIRLRESNDGYDHICTHVDDFKVVARDATRWTTKIAGSFLLKTLEEPKYYLGNDYSCDKEAGAWMLSCKTYLKECIRRVEDLLTDGDFLHKNRPPCQRIFIQSWTRAHYWMMVDDSGTRC
jgi:hypothetical protein